MGASVGRQTEKDITYGVKKVSNAQRGFAYVGSDVVVFGLFATSCDSLAQPSKGLFFGDVVGLLRLEHSCFKLFEDHGGAQFQVGVQCLCDSEREWKGKRCSDKPHGWPPQRAPSEGGE